VVEHGLEGLPFGGEPSDLLFHPAANRAQDGPDELDDVGGAEEAGPARLVGSALQGLGVVVGIGVGGTDFSVSLSVILIYAGFCSIDSRVGLQHVLSRAPLRGTDFPVFRSLALVAAGAATGSVRDGVAYVGSSDAAAAFAFDTRSGRRLWKADVHGWAWGQPAVTDDRAFVGTAALRGYQNDVHRGGVVALDRATGRAVWRYALEPPTEGAWGFPGSPAVSAGHVFVTGVDGRVLAFVQ
jgi:hypothetical protein